jgi:hypothetical protein
MDRHPRKSKALLITFIILVILLVIGYFLLQNTKTVDPVTGETTTSSNKVFSSLFGTAKKKQLVPVENQEKDGVVPSSSNGTQVQPGTNTPIDAGIGSGGSFGAGTGFGVNAGFGTTGSFAPALNPLPSPSGTFNGNLGFTSGTFGGLSFGNNPISGGGSGTSTPGSTPVLSGSADICPVDDPLTYTDAEKAELEVLLRQYYLLASTIKNNDDIAVLNNELAEYRALINKANDFTNQCVAEKTAPGYTGPQSVLTNPYYSGGSSSSTYLPGEQSPWIQANPGASIADYPDFENIFNIW